MHEFSVLPFDVVGLVNQQLSVSLSLSFNAFSPLLPRSRPGTVLGICEYLTLSLDAVIDRRCNQG